MIRQHSSNGFGHSCRRKVLENYKITDKDHEHSGLHSCLDYCHYGREGYSGGFTKCKLLHLVLCRGSLRKNECFDPNCPLADVKGTVRIQPRPPMHRPPGNQAGGNIYKHYGEGKGYSRFDTNELGFYGYRQTRGNSR